MLKGILVFIGVLVLTILLAIGLQLAGLEWMRFFNPKVENVRREVFENTKSYTHGKIQDLAKYYEEYQKTEDKEAVAAIIKMRFAEFDANKINSDVLRTFLINIRGY